MMNFILETWEDIANKWKKLYRNSEEDRKCLLLENRVLKAKVEAMEKKAKEFIEAAHRDNANDIDYWCGQSADTIMVYGSEAEKKARE